MIMFRQLKWEFDFCREVFGTLPTLWWAAIRLLWDLVHPADWVWYRADSVWLPPKTKPRVLLVTSDCGIGSGAFRCAVELTKALRQRGAYDVFVITPDHGDGEALLRENNIPFACVPSWSWVVRCNTDMRRNARKLITRIVRNHFAVRNLAKLIRRHDVDLVHCNTTWTYVGALAACRCKIPYVWHLREFLQEGQRCTIMNEKSGFPLMRQASLRIAISDAVREKYVSSIDGMPIDRIYDGVDVARFYRPKHSVFQKDELTFVFVGSYQEQKGHDVFCRACVELWRKGVRNFKVVFVGARIEDRCRHYFVEADMLQAVTFCGMQPEPVKYTENADIAFVCSRAEGFGLVTVEAMLAGCLVIGANRAGTAELIRYGETGLLFKMTDAKEHDDLVRQIEYAMANPEMSRKMAAAGRDYMYKNMSLERNADGVARVYEKVLSEEGLNHG